jgi:hypothetical protein
MKQKRYTTSVDFYRPTAKRYLDRKSKTSHRPHREDKQRKAIGEVRGYQEKITIRKKARITIRME